MKTQIIAVLLWTSSAASMLAQNVNPPADNQVTIPDPITYQQVDSGANFRAWKSETTETLADGQVVIHSHSYTEMGSGLNYRDPNGQWLPSQAVIEPYAQGAIAHRGQHQVIFANNLNSVGATDEQTPDGKRLRSNILGLLYVDATTGQAVQIAQIHDSEGQLVAANQVLYTNAFDGVKADVLYEYRLDGMMQDVVLRAQLPAPELFGINSATVELEVMTEFLNPPEASVWNIGVDSHGMEPDQAVSWGATSLGKGRAFSLGGQDVPAPVTKQYVNLEGRYFLFEKVRYRDIRQSLSSLPLQASNARGMPGMASTHPKLPKAPSGKQVARPIRLAQGGVGSKGYVLDYVSLNTAYTNFTFQGDSTYYVSGTLNLSGTNYFEGNAIIKYAANAAINGVAGSIMIFSSAPYRPVVFTSKDDNSVGEGITGSTGSPSGYYANPALTLGSTTNSLGNFRISYANRALSVSGGAPTIYSAQLLNCATAISDVNGPVTLENVLLSNIKTNFNATSATNVISVQNATFYNSFDLVNGNTANTTFTLTNCALVNATNLSGTVSGGYNGFYRSPPVGSSWVTNTSNPVQTVGGGSYYLTNGSAFLDAGTLNVDPSTLRLIQAKTVYPPVVYSSITFTTITNFSPQAQRDTNTPDLGYHYEPLDYAFGNVTAKSNMTFTAGAAVAWFYTAGGATYSISVADSATANFAGTVTSPCRWVKFNTVQEGNGNWTAQSFSGAMTGGSFVNAAPKATAQFTMCSVLAAEAGAFAKPSGSIVFVFAGNNCEFYTAGVGGYYCSVNVTNCLFYNCGAGLHQNYNAANMTLQGCTFFRGHIEADHTTGSTWPVTILNCAFDKTTLNMNAHGLATNGYYTDYNSFIIGYNTTTNFGGHEVYVTNSYNWQSSWLGDFYLPTNSPVIDKGSTSADSLGLYHFTSQTNQMKEANSIVDIGYHYVAVDGYGNPMDFNGDSIPDYIEDTNGNGLVDTGEFPWNFYSTNLVVWLMADRGVTNGVSNRPSAWGDQSGHNNYATQSNTNNQPYYITNVISGHPVVRFDGTNDSLALPNNCLDSLTQAEFYVVLKVNQDPPASDVGFCWFGTSGFHTDYPSGSGAISDDFGSTTLHTVGNPAQPLNQFQIYNAVSTAGGWSARLNGTVIYATSGNTVSFRSSPNLGYSGNYLAGDIAEMLIFNKSLSGPEVNAVNQYLNGKYGMVAAVPSTPTNLVAQAISTNQIYLAWSEPLTNGGATQISIERSTASNGVFTAIAQISSALSYVDTNLPSATTYFYRLRAINLTGWSGYSAVASATTLTNGTSLPLGAMALWLRGDAGLVETGTNTPVSIWLDQSTNGNNAMQPTGNYQANRITGALNGLPVVRFDGTNDSFALPDNCLSSLTQAELYVVLKVNQDPPASDGGFYWFGVSGLHTDYPSSSGVISDDFGSTTLHTVGNPVQPLNQFEIYNVVSTSGGWTNRINGTVAYMTGGNTVSFRSSPNLGYSGNYFAGDMAEMLIFNRSLSSDEQTTVNAYLSKKYGMIPAVGISNPTNNAVFATGSNISICASTSEIDGGSINHVDFFSGSTNIGTSGGPSFCTTWNNVAAGSSTTNVFILTAIATGTNGLTGTSVPITIAVDPPPIVSITSPVNNVNLGIAPVTVLLTASASDVTGIKQVQFFQGTNSLGIITNLMASVIWSAVPSGNYSLTAVATGNDGLTSTSSLISVLVDTDTDGDGLGDFQETLYGTNPNATNAFDLWISTPSGTTSLP